MVIFAEERLREISKRLELPQWWVTSAIVEYLPCRRFAENKKLWVFDFKIFNQIEEENKIQRKSVIVPQYVLFQNTKSLEVAYRLPKLMTGQSKLPVDNVDIVPEGIVNNTAFPFFSNPIDRWDPKIGFNEYAIVYDSGYFYQWKIAESYNITEAYSWFKSTIVARQ